MRPVRRASRPPSRPLATRAATLLAATCLVVACGGASAEKHAPRVPVDKTPARPATEEPTYAEPPPLPPPADRPTSTADTAGASTSREASARKAIRDVEGAQRELDEAGGDCKAACRALGAMDRAAGHLCKMSETTDERAHCDAAKGKVYKARDRVRTACGTCPGGPSVDHGAPIPSQ